MRKRFADAIKSLEAEEFLLAATDQKEMGSAINKNKKAINPRNTTGSTVKILKSESIIERKKLKGLRKVELQLDDCLNKIPPPKIDIKTGVQAAKTGFIVPLTPRELKAKLIM